MNCEPGLLVEFLMTLITFKALVVRVVHMLIAQPVGGEFFFANITFKYFILFL